MKEKEDGEISDLELWFEATSDKPVEKYFIERNIKIESLEIELAFHEASHFVFNCMALKCVTGFMSINSIISCAEKLNVNGFNVVNGFAPDVPEDKTYVRDHNEEAIGYLEFYNEDRKRLVAKILTLTAGYSSYQIFIKNDKYYIGVKNDGIHPVGTGLLRMKYFSKKAAISSNTSDFKKLSKKLRIYYHLSMDERNEAISRLTSYTQEIMQIQAVNDSIRFVKNQLVKNKCTKIKGSQLSTLVSEVNRLTNKVPFEDLLVKLSNKIE